jgi:hypothetical protein
VLVVAVVVVAAGCGGSSKKPAAAGTTATTSTLATTTSSLTTTTKLKTTFASSKNCAELAALGAKMSQAMQAASGKGGASVTDEANVFKAMASAAPSEIRGDFETFANAFYAYAQAMGKAGFKPGTTPTPAQIAQLATAAKAFSAPELQKATQHLTAWSQSNCH